MRILANTKEGNAQVGNFQKVFFILPLTFIFMVVFTKLDLNLRKSTVFYIFAWLFVGALALALILLGIKDMVELHKDWADQHAQGRQFPHMFLKTLEKWTTTYFAITSELYSAVFLNLCVWAYANAICSKEEAYRFYPLINIFGTLTTMLSGIMQIMLGLYPIKGKNAEAAPSLIMLGVVILLNILLIWVFYRAQKAKGKFPQLDFDAVGSSGKKKKIKLGLKASLVYLFTNAYIFQVMFIVAAYGLVQGFFETFYSNNLKLYAKGYDLAPKVIKGAETMIMSFIIFLCLFFIGYRSVSYFGWTKSAIVSPIIIAVFGSAYLITSFANYGNMHSIYEKLWASTRNNSKHLLDTITLEEHQTNFIVYVFGTLCVNLTRSLKYSFFDPTKELAFFVLDKEERARAKAAVDLVGSRIGKSGSALIFLILISCTHNEINQMIAIAVLFILILIPWIYCTISAGSKYNAMSQQLQREEEEAKEKNQEKQDDDVGTTSNDNNDNDIIKSSMAFCDRNSSKDNLL